MDDFRRIHVIEPGDLNWCAGFNPLRLDSQTETAVRVDAMVAACAQVWGGENTNATPLLKKCLRAVFYTLAIRNLTLAEAPILTSSESDLRRSLIADLPDPVFNAVWRDFDALSRREFYEQFSSTNNRLLEVLSSPVVRRIVGQRDRALDLRAVMDAGEIVIGVTFDPTRNELFAAEKQKGATLNNKPIRVSDTEKLSESLIVTGFPYDFKQKENFARHLTDFLLNSRGVRRDGSAAIDMAYVACGRFDGFWEEGLNPWDVAAGVLLIEEAGGQVSYYNGEKFSIYAPPICASNGAIHGEMLNVLR